MDKLSHQYRKFIRIFVALVLCAAFLAVPQGNAYAMPFYPAVNYIVGDTPRSVAVGDFNGDGNLDLAVANEADDDVSILLGNGDGTFNYGENYLVGTSPTSVAVGDFDGDGNLDLAVANGGADNNVSILLGNGDGTFTATVPYPVGSGPLLFVAVGYFNGDSYLDLAVVNYGSNDVSILLGVGDGTFTAAAPCDVGSNPYSVAVGDFNSDNKTDLAVANGGSSDVSILLGVGDGTFNTTGPYGVGTTPLSVAVGDFNSDNTTDLAVANFNSSDVSILLGVGNGTFSAAVDYDVGTGPASVAVGDFNGDGNPDLAVANNGSKNISILLGYGDGTFSAAVDYDVGTGPISVAVGDFNDDNKPDLAVANANVSSNNVSILLNTPTPSVSSVNPNSGNQGQTLSSVVITGNYFTGATAVSFGSGITVNSFNTDNLTQITANISIDAAASQGTRDVSVTTPGGTNTLTGGFTVNLTSPTVISVNPNSGNQGQTLSSVVITGNYFTGATAVSFGSGITVNSFNTDNLTQIRANIAILSYASPGTRNVTVTTPGGTATLTDGFTVNRAGEQTKSINTATGTGTATFTTSNGFITGLTAAISTPCETLPGFIFPHGFFSFNITNIPAGSTVIITITLPSNMPMGTQYWKCINGQWVDCSSLLGDNDRDNTLTLTITDGGLGDADGVANGTIVDPGGPAFMLSAPAARRVSPTLPNWLKPAQMSLLYLNVNPQQASANQPVTIITNVVNTGDEAGNYNIALKINGQVEQTKTVSVGPQGTQPVKFTVTKAQPGTYAIDVGGQTGSFTILGAGGSAGAPLSGGWIAILIISVLIPVTMVVLMLKFRRAAQKRKAAQEDILHTDK